MDDMATITLTTVIIYSFTAVSIKTHFKCLDLLTALLLRRCSLGEICRPDATQSVHSSNMLNSSGLMSQAEVEVNPRGHTDQTSGPVAKKAHPQFFCVSVSQSACEQAKGIWDS